MEHLSLTLIFPISVELMAGHATQGNNAIAFMKYCMKKEKLKNTLLLSLEFDHLVTYNTKNAFFPYRLFYTERKY